MKMLPVLHAAALVLTLSVPLSHSSAQQPANPEELRKLCETVLCRKPGVVGLTLDSGKPFEKKFDLPRPIAHDGWVSVFPGETIFVEAEVHGSQLINLRAVERNDHPEKTLSFQFSQDPGASSMTLIVTNPFEKNVKYHAGMMLPTGDKLLKTSSCPVLGGGRVAFESWSNAILQLVLFDFRLLDEGTKQMACEF